MNPNHPNPAELVSLEKAATEFGLWLKRREAAQRRMLKQTFTQPARMLLRSDAAECREIKEKFDSLFAAHRSRR